MTTRLRAFVVDDEPLALDRLARLLDETGRVEVVGRETDPDAGLAALGSLAVDVLFVDIQMPELNGFQLVEHLARDLPPGTAAPMVVFVTAFDEFAVRAFDVNAVDYLLKPVERRRLERTLNRLERLRDDPARAGLVATLARLAESLRPAAAFVERLPLRQGERVQLLDVQDITHVVAKERATYAVTATGTHMLDDTIAELERKLDPARFFRIHRGALVNVACIGELHADLGGRLLIRLKGPSRTELVVARDRVRPLKDHLGV